MPTTPTPTFPSQPMPPTANQPMPELPQKQSKTMWYVIGALIVLVILVGILYVAMRKTKNTSYTMQVAPKELPTMQPTLARSKPVGMVTNVVTAPALDATGNAASRAATFPSIQKTIFLVLTVNNPKIGTKFEYIRYLNNKYLDSGILKVTKPNVTNTSFSWTLKPRSAHLTGSYKVKVYTNGIFEKEATYTVQ